MILNALLTSWWTFRFLSLKQAVYSPNHVVIHKATDDFYDACQTTRWSGSCPFPNSNISAFSTLHTLEPWRKLRQPFSWRMERYPETAQELGKLASLTHSHNTPGIDGLCLIVWVFRGRSTEYALSLDNSLFTQFTLVLVMLHFKVFSQMWGSQSALSENPWERSQNLCLLEFWKHQYFRFQVDKCRFLPLPWGLFPEYDRLNRAIVRRIICLWF